MIYLFISCQTSLSKKFEINKVSNNYRFWYIYHNSKKDSITINFLLSYQIINNTNRSVKLDWIRKRPNYYDQAERMRLDDSLVLFDRIINKKANHELLFFSSKVVSINDFPDYSINLISLYRNYRKNFTKYTPEEKEFMKSPFFQTILNEIKNDSIAIVFRDSVEDDYFEFKGIIKDDKLQFSR